MDQLHQARAHYYGLHISPNLPLLSSLSPYTLIALNVNASQYKGNKAWHHVIDNSI